MENMFVTSPDGNRVVTTFTSNNVDLLTLFISLSNNKLFLEITVAVTKSATAIISIGKSCNFQEIIMDT